MLKFTSILLAALLFAHCAAQPDESLDSLDEIEERKARVTNYDMLVLAQSWPQTSCWNLNKRWPSGEATCSKCKMPKNENSWTAHGLWPSNRHGKHPFNCNNVKYNPKLLSSSLRTMMEEKWPTFNLKMNIDAFWSHEWSKHGTCAMELEITNSLPKYFSKTIKMVDQYNIGTILAEAGIVSGKKYKYSDLFKVIENTLGVKTYIKCAINPGSHEQYIQEVNVCFDKSFKLDNCNDDNQTNCKSEVIYPRNLNTC